MKIKKVIYTLLVIIWMMTIFYFSGQNSGTSSNTSKNVSQIILNVIDIQNRYTEQEKEELSIIIEPVIRKIAHYTIYLVGGVLLINCVYEYIANEEKSIIISYIIGTTYALSDEIHQLFVSGRSGQIQDVIIDSIGVLTGIAIYLLLKKVFNKNLVRWIRG